MITIGADPELFLEENGTIVSGYGEINGTKTQPWFVDNGAVQVDGMALEFNIDPASNEEQFLFNIHSVLSQLRQMVPGRELALVPVAYFDEAYMQSQPKEALDLGCDPDFNAWSGMVNKKPDVNLPMRTAAGHVHVGWTENEDENDSTHIDMCRALVQQLDFYLGLPSLFLDKDTKRREMYGCAGAFRPKSYGVEYRVLSNFWLTSDDLIAWVFRNVTLAIQNIDDSLAQKYGDIQDVINNSDKERALEIIHAEQIPMPEVS